MAAEVSRDRPIFILELSVIHWGIGVLVGRRTHPFFPGYLEIRRAASQQGSLTEIHPSWDDIGQFLRVPGGPPKRPYYRPFWDQSSGAGQHWMNENLAGSYAPSSIRHGTVPRKVVDIDRDGNFSLKGKHWELARKHLLHGEQMPVLPLCVFLYRDFGFTTDGPSIGPHNLIQVFREDFGYGSDADDAEFSHLYDAHLPDRTDWFAPLEAEAAL